MKVTVEKKEGLERILTVEVPLEVINTAIEEQFNKIKKTAKIPGFRPGKVPQKVLVQRYGDAVRQEILSDVLRSTLMEAIDQEKLNPAGMPEIAVKEYVADKPLVYTATFEEYPEVDVKPLDGVKIEQVKAELTDGDIEKVLENMRKQHANWKEVDRDAKLDDQVVIDYEGFKGKEAFEGGKAAEVPLVLGSKSMIPGFEEGIIGAKAGDELEIKVTFPKEYQNKDLAGAKATFKIKVHKVQEAELPALDDKLAETFGVKEGGLAHLKEDLKKKMTSDLQFALSMKNKNTVIDKLLETNEVLVPKALIKSEIEHLKEQMFRQFGENFDRSKLPALPDNMFEDEAKRRVTIGLLVGSVIKKEKMEAEPDRVKALIEEAAQMYQNPKEVVDWYYQDKNRVAQFEMLAIENQVLDKLAENAKIGVKEVDYETATAR